MTGSQRTASQHYRPGGFLVSKIHQLSGRVFARKLREHGIVSINPAQGRILFVLWQEDGISIQELAKRTSLGKSTLTSMLDRLESSGELTRVPAEGDRRKTLICLTQKDRDLRETYDRVSDEMNDLYYAGLSPSEIDAVERGLARVLENLEQASQPGKDHDR